MKTFTVLLIGFAIAFAGEVYSFQSSKLPFNWEDYSNEYLIRNYKVQDGLPVNSVNFVLHHTDGFMYLATNDGLVKYDGIEFTILNTATHPQLQSNRIASLKSGTNNVLWILDKQNSLYQLKAGIISAVYISDVANGKRLNTYEILSSGQSVLGINEGLLLTNENGELTSVQNSQKQVIESAEFNNQVYYLTEEGLFRFNGTTVSKFVGAEQLKIAVDQVQKLKFTTDGVLWLLGRNGLLIEVAINGEQVVHQYTNDILIWDIAEINNNEILVISNREYLIFNRNERNFAVYQITEKGGGVYTNDAMDFGFRGVITKESQAIFIDKKQVLNASRRILHVTADREGSLWVATNGEGVYQILQKKMITIGEDDYAGLKNIYGIDWSDDELWVTTFESGVYRINSNYIERWNRSTMGEGFNLFRSISIQEERIIAGNFGLWVRENNEWKRPRGLLDDNERVDAIFTDSNERTWIGTNSGLYKYKNGELSPYVDTEGESITSVRKIQELENGDILVSTGQQGVAFINSDNKLSFISNDSGLSSNSIRDVHISSKDTLWVASEDRGLNRVVLGENKQVREIKIVRKTDGLIDNSLHRIIEDEFGYFWVNSNSGIIRISKSILNGFLDGSNTSLFLRSFGLNDGLENLEGNGGVQNAGLLTDDGRLLLPNQAGLIYTRTEWHIQESEVVSAKPVIGSVIFSDSVISSVFENIVEIPLGERDVQIKMTLPTFESPDRLNLEYLLEEVNSEWQEVSGERMAIFTNIPPGKHSLRVRGNLFGDQGFSESSFMIIVPYYFYETVWFKGLLGILFIGVFFVSLSMSVRRYKDREATLNKLVDERTEQLLTEKERTEQALKQVQEIDRSKSQFFTNFTHELRTPLSLILGPLEDMIESKGGGSGSEKKNLHLMKRNAVRLKDLVNQLLDVSKLSAGELTLTFEPVDLVNLTKHIVSQFEHNAEKKEIEITVRGEKELPELYIDSSAWNHICMNLLSNALKYTEEAGKINIEIKAIGKHIEISFQDTGTGISGEDLPHIFDAYYQGKNEVNRTGGTGIGLALTKGLVEQMSGIIDVESQKGKGTRFTILLSIGKDHIRSTHEIIESDNTDIVNVAELPVIDIDELSVPETNSQLGEAKVLLVEDNDDFRSYLKSAISEKYDVEVAENGLEGLKMMSHFKPDIVVSDIMMPKMNGLEMMKEIRTTKDFQHIPFVFLSAKDSEFDIETGLNLGADIYLTKPVKNKLLLTQIRVLLRREKSLKKTIHNSEENSLSPLVKSVQEIIYRHLGNPDLNVELIASALSMSETSLYRKWKKEGKETLNTTISRLRFEEAIKLFSEENLSISEAAFAVGYNHLSSFSKAFKKMYGSPPQEYLNKNLEKN